MKPESRILKLAIELPPPPKPAGVYSLVVQTDNTLYVSGHIPVHSDGNPIVGKLGADFSEQQGYDAARLVGLLMLATLRDHLGSLDRVSRVLKVTGMVNATPGFVAHPKVINGFSELMMDVFGDSGRAARSAAGMVSLPLGVPVEVEAIFELEK